MKKKLIHSQKKKEKLTPLFKIILIYIVFIYARPFYYLTFLLPFKLPKITMIIAVLMFFADKRKKKFIFKEPTFNWFLILQILTIILIPIGLWKQHSLEYWMGAYSKIFITFILLYFVASNSKNYFRLILKTIFLSSAFVGVMLIKAYLSGQYIFVGASKRVVGVVLLATSDPNDVALVLDMVIPIGFYLFATCKKFSGKIIYLGLIGVLFIALLNTGSRGGYLGFLVGILFFFAHVYRKQKLKFVGMVIVFMLIAVFALPQQYKDRFQSIYKEQDYNTTNEQGGRIAIWKRGLETAKKTPFGVGLRNYSLAEGQRKSEENIGGQWLMAHNSYLEILVELGWFGLFAYLMLLLSGFKNIKMIVRISEKRKDKDSQIAASAFFGSMMGFMVASFFLSQGYYWSHYITLALIAALKHNVIREAKL